MAQFRIKEISEKEVKFFFLDKFLVYDADMALITGMEIGAFQRMEIGGYPLLFPLDFAGKNFFTDITAFIRFYKTLLFLEAKGQQIEHIGIRCYSDRILMQIIF